MATKSIPQSKSIIEKVSTLAITESYVIVSDPCYLDDIDENGWLMACPSVYGWGGNISSDEIGSANVFEVRNDNRIRALVLCTHDSPPAVLMDKKLTGNFYTVDKISVDCGMVGFFNEMFMGDKEGENVSEWEKDTNGYWNYTYRGDGTFPVVVFAENGIAHTIAILTDSEYYS